MEILFENRYKNLSKENLLDYVKDVYCKYPCMVGIFFIFSCIFLLLSLL